jgi:hypothetical protein
MLAALVAVVPLLEKVKAHDDEARDRGYPKAVGNATADEAARHAATSEQVTLFNVDLSPFGDPVVLVDAAGAEVAEVRAALAALWWERRQESRSVRRPWLDKLYPPEEEVLWDVSTGIFRRPVVSGGVFVHAAPATVVKWVARVRAGCLASRLRLFSHGMEASAACPGCGAEEEDEEHMVSGCSGTGSVRWLPMVREIWRDVAQELAVTVPVPPETCLHHLRLPLLAALIPAALARQVALPPGPQQRFLRLLHQRLAADLAERLRRREALVAVAAAASGSEPPQDLAVPGGLPPERRLTVAELGMLESQRQAALELAPSPSGTPPADAAVVNVSDDAAPLSGEARRRWLRGRLEALLRDDTVACAESGAVTAGSVRDRHR